MMRSHWFNILVFACAALCVQSVAVQDFLEVKYNPRPILGERSSATVTLPNNVLFSLYETFYAPNGTSTTSLKATNVFDGRMPADNPNGWIDPNANRTCVPRNDPLTWSTEPVINSHLPDSTGIGWGYSFTLNLYYSTGYEYSYIKNTSLNAIVVCAEKPIIVETLKTHLQAIEVHPIAVGTGEGDGAFVTGKWQLSPSPAGQAIIVMGAAQRFSMSWVVILTAILTAFSLVEYTIIV